MTELPIRIRDKIMIAEDGCWLWTGAVQANGYGRAWDGKNVRYAHRVVYQLLVGPINAEGLDHLCRQPLCVNPRHLEPVSNHENQLRGNRNQNTAKTTCPKGHPYSGVNHVGARICHTCRNENERNRLRRGR